MSSIEICYEDIESIQLNSTFLKKLVQQLIRHESKKTGEISIIFCSDAYLLDLNTKYLNHNYYTDIITFDYCSNDVISGDLFISLERVSENAGIFDTSFKKELYRVVIHGVLHLIGYKDKETKERAVMRGKEDYYLKGIDFDRKKI